MKSSLWNWEKRFVRDIAFMEQTGVLVNRELAQSEMALGQSRMAAIATDLDGLNPASPKDLEYLLLGRLGLPIVRYTDKGAPSFDKHAMEEYELLLRTKQDTTAQSILEYRGWQKACSTYFDKFLLLVSEDGRLRPNFKLHGTRTGRLSCETPNLQQIPRQTSEAKRWGLNTKKCITALNGWRLWELDYANLELRLAAIYSGETALINAFNTGTVGIWDMMSELLGGWEKTKTKTVTYATLYGAGTKRLALTMGVPMPEAKKTKRKYFGTFPKLQWASNTINEGAKEAGYVRYWTGRRRHFPPSESAHKAFNSVLQGGGAEIVKRALIEIAETVCDSKCRLVLTVHDSIVLEIREGFENVYLPKAKAIMERIPTEYFQMTFTVDNHVWGE